MSKFKSKIFGDVNNPTQPKIIDSPKSSSKLPFKPVIASQAISSPPKEHGTYVSDQIYAISLVEARPKYIHLELSNHDGSINGKIWATAADQSDLMERLSQSPVIIINGRYDEYPKDSGNISIVISSFSCTDDIADAGSLVQSITNQEYLDDLSSELMFYIEQMTQEHQTFAIELLSCVWPQFTKAPAAVGHHHNYVNGLFEHTIEVMRIFYHLATKSSKEEIFEEIMKIKDIQTKAFIEDFTIKQETATSRYVMSFINDDSAHFEWFISNVIKRTAKEPMNINLSLGLLSTLFHDVAKIIEYGYPNDDKAAMYELFLSMDIPASKSYSLNVDSVGSTYGHLVLGSNMIAKHQSETEYPLPYTDILDIQHIILSHHGKLEWGAVTTPRTVTALLVHIADYIDAKFATEK